MVVRMSDDAKDSRRDLGVLTKETVAVTDLDHEKDVGVLRFELENLLLEWSVLRVLSRGFWESNGGSGRVEEL